MSETFSGFVEITNAAGATKFRLDADSSNFSTRNHTGKFALTLDNTSNGVFLAIGSNENPAHFSIKNGLGRSAFEFNSVADSNSTTFKTAEFIIGARNNQGELRINNGSGSPVFQFICDAVRLFRENGVILSIGGGGAPSELQIRDGSGADVISLASDTGTISVGRGNKAGRLVIRDGSGQVVFNFDSEFAALYLGSNGNEGDLIVRDADNKERIKLDGGEGDIWIKDTNGNFLFHFDSEFAALYLGSNGNEGDLIVRDADNKERIKLDGGEGDIWIKDTNGNFLFHFDSEFAALYLGGVGNEGDLILRNSAGNQTIKLDGEEGDIILSNADCAEDFDVTDNTDIEPGTVVSIDEKGELRKSLEAYERTVAGVISGGGAFKPGICLDRRETGKKRLPVALVGKVYCKVDASFGSIQFGDLLTSSSTPGYAMKASDPSRAFGAVIGKALQPLESGQGLIPILVALQ